MEQAMIPSILLVVQLFVLLVLAFGFVVGHLGPRSLHDKISRFYQRKIAHIAPNSGAAESR
jgi:hypothetical protein